MIDVFTLQKKKNQKKKNPVKMSEIRGEYCGLMV